MASCRLLFANFKQGCPATLTSHAAMSGGSPSRGGWCGRTSAARSLGPPLRAMGRSPQVNQSNQQPPWVAQLHALACMAPGCLPWRGEPRGGQGPRPLEGARPKRPKGEGSGEAAGSLPMVLQGPSGRGSATTGRAISPPSLPNFRGSDGGGTRSAPPGKTAERLGQTRQTRRGGRVSGVSGGE
jgi:hypothetical protein